MTAGAAGFSLLTVIEAASDSLSLPLHAETIGSTIQGPKAEISGTTVGIQTQNNDGNVDVGVVYPALQLSDVLGRRTVPVEIPKDHVSFPVIGAKDLPGNIVIPRQTEYLFYSFEKANYHFFVPDRDTYDVVVLAGRASASNLGGASLNDVTTRRVGIEREVAVNGNLSLKPACDLDLSPAITVRVPEAPAGTAVEAVSVADVPEPGGPRTLLYDVKSSMAQDLDHFTLSGLNPIGDLSTSVPYVAARYHDNSPTPAFESGRVDRTPLTLPATRSLDGFFLVPELSQSGGEFTWTQVRETGGHHGTDLGDRELPARAGIADVVGGLGARRSRSVRASGSRSRSAGRPPRYDARPATLDVGSAGRRPRGLDPGRAGGSVRDADTLQPAIDGDHAPVAPASAGPGDARAGADPSDRVGAPADARRSGHRVDAAAPAR